MYRNKVMTTSLAILAIATAISLVTASTGSGIVTTAFAVKKSSDTTGTSNSSKKGTSSTSGTSIGSKSKFVKCVTAISGSLSRATVDNCWDEVFGSGVASGLTLGAGTSSSSSSGHGSTSTGGSST